MLAVLARMLGVAAVALAGCGSTAESGWLVEAGREGVVEVEVLEGEGGGGVSDAFGSEGPPVLLGLLPADGGPLAVTARRPSATFRALGSFNARTLALRPLRLAGEADRTSSARAATPIEFAPPGPDLIDHIVLERPGGSGDPFIVTGRNRGYVVVECERGGQSLGGFDAVAARYVRDLDREPFWLGESVEDGAVLDFHVSDPPAFAFEGGQPVVYVTCQTPFYANRGAAPREADVADMADGHVLRVPLGHAAQIEVDGRRQRKAAGEIVAFGCRPVLAGLAGDRMLMCTRSRRGHRPARMYFWRSEGDGAWAAVAPPSDEPRYFEGHDLLGLGEGVLLAAWSNRGAAGERVHVPEVSMRFWWWEADGAGWRPVEAPVGSPRIRPSDLRGEMPRIHLVAGPRPGAALALWTEGDGVLRGFALECP